MSFPQISQKIHIWWWTRGITQREAAAHIASPETTTGRTCRAEEVQLELPAAHRCRHTHAHLHKHTYMHIYTHTYTHTHMNAPSNSVRLICFGYSIIFLVEYLKNQIKLCIRYTNNAPLPPHGCCETLINVCKVLSDPQKKGTIEVRSLIISQHTKVEVKRSSLLLMHKTTDLNSCIKKPPRC